LAVPIFGGCDLRISGNSLWQDESSKLSPRVVELGQPVPKGGGRYKVGAPYKIRGKLYRPEEVSHYDENGIASWYGELFHGRRTANGEIYDMEALTAAHPTLPLPSYVRVTNLRNGRSLVLRVNDRGPYARDRVIDLSWAVASLLQMRAAGTAPVRVQYIGPAPLSGSDRYERTVLARQPWAGPRVAYAASPGKAIRYRQAALTTRQSVTRQLKTATVASIPSEIRLSVPNPKSSIRPFAVSHTLKTNLPKTAVISSPPQRLQPLAGSAKGSERPASSTARPIEIVSLSAKGMPLVRRPDKIRMKTDGFYVEAGLFPKKRLADQLAEILQEIAPAWVEPMAIGNRVVHRVRLGPFSQSADAQIAAKKIREAGLTAAQVEDGIDG
jgi:rare lipoprotein A